MNKPKPVPFLLSSHLQSLEEQVRLGDRKRRGNGFDLFMFPAIHCTVCTKFDSIGQKVSEKFECRMKMWHIFELIYIYIGLYVGVLYK